MATIFTITGTQDQALLLRDALCNNYNYQEFIDEAQTVPNPESQGDFAKRMVTQWLIENVKAYRARQADASRLQAISDAETESTGIGTA